MTEKIRSIIGWVFLIAVLFTYNYFTYWKTDQNEIDANVFKACLEDNDIEITNIYFEGSYPSVKEIENYLNRIIEISYNQEYDQIEAESIRVYLKVQMDYCSSKYKSLTQ